jgi:hypothetical protein
VGRREEVLAKLYRLNDRSVCVRKPHA